MSDGTRTDIDDRNWYERAESLAAQERFDEAEAAYEAGVTAGHRECYAGLAAMYEGLDRLDEAIAVWRDATAAGLPGSRSALAAVMRRLGRFEEALELHRTAIAHGDLTGVSGFARLLWAQGRVEEAFLACRSVLDEDAVPSRVTCWSVGDFLREHGRAQEALAVYRRGVAVDGSASRSRLVQLLSDLDRVDEAIATAREGIAAGDLTSYRSLGFVLMRHGRRDEAAAEHARLVAEGHTGTLMQLVTGFGQGQLKQAVAPRDQQDSTSHLVI